MIRLVPASGAHVGRLANSLREIDRMECQAMGRSPKQALRIGIKASIEAWTAIEDGRPLAMFGVMATSLISGSGVAWFLGTDEVFNYRRRLLTDGPVIIARWMRDFRVLRNVVAVDNHKALRLLRYWGATISDEVEMHGGVEFVPFRIERAAIQGQPQPA